MTGAVFHDEPMLEPGKNPLRHKASVLSKPGKFRKWNTYFFPGGNVSVSDVSPTRHISKKYVGAHIC